jgi:hypothetical protein
MRTSIGRWLITVGALLTAVVPNLADWNRTHIFSELWSPHARFHGAWQVLHATAAALISLWLMWLKRGDRSLRMTLAALLLVAVWACFCVSYVVPGVALADPGRRYHSVLGIEPNTFLALLVLLLSAAGYWLERKAAGNQTPL